MCARIAVDVDDTLYSFARLARNVMAEEGYRTGDARLIAGAYAVWPEWRTPPDMVGLDTWMHIIDLCHDEDMILEQTPYDDAAETLWELHRQGHELLYISNRNTERTRATRQWLINSGFPIGTTLTRIPHTELICTAEDKKPYVADCQYIIDDRPKTLVNFVYDIDWHPQVLPEPPGPRKGFALMTEFNRGLTDVPGIYLAPTWQGIRYYMERKGLLEHATV
jgi:hypothetical protein